MNYSLAWFCQVFHLDKEMAYFKKDYQKMFKSDIAQLALDYRRGFREFPGAYVLIWSHRKEHGKGQKKAMIILSPGAVEEEDINGILQGYILSIFSF